MIREAGHEEDIGSSAELRLPKIHETKDTKFCRLFVESLSLENHVLDLWAIDCFINYNLMEFL
jgi:hypothetical protein